MVLVYLLAVGSLIGAQPQRDVGRLHRLPHYVHQFVIQSLQVRLIPQLCSEGLQGLSCIILPAVEAAVNEALHPPTQRVEQSGYGERGGYDSQGGLLACQDAQEGLQADHASYVDQGQRDRKCAVDEGAVDDHVYVVEPMPHDGYAREDRQTEQAEADDRVADRGAPDGDYAGHEDGSNHHRAPVGEPLDLLALHRPRLAHPNDERDCRRHHRDPAHDGADDTHHQYWAVDAVGVRDLRVTFERTGPQPEAGYEPDDPERRAPGHGPPARRGWPAVRKQQQQEGRGYVYPEDPRQRGEPRRRLAEAPQRRIASEAVLSVAPREAAEAYHQPYAAKDPTYGVAGLAGGDDSAHHREGEQRDEFNDRAGRVCLALVRERKLRTERSGHKGQRDPARKQRHG